MTDYRAELQRLVKAYDEHGGRWPDKDVQALHNAVEAARTTLAQPEPKTSRLRYCDVHGQQPENAWGCPECVREMRHQLAQPEPQGPSELELEAIELKLWDKHRTKGCRGEEFMYDNDFSAALDEYRDLLAQPEPEGVTERIASIATAVQECAFGWEPTARLIGNVCAEDVADLCGAILTRYARPAIEPVPVSERLPGPEDCDSEDQCWLWRTDGIEEFWELVIPSYNIHEYNWTSQWKYTHWLPHWALPVPAPANTINQNNY
jgi:hypothetical protein